MCPTPVASPLAHCLRTFVVCGCMCGEIVVYASACVFRNKMTFAMKLDYIEEDVHSVNLTRSSSEARHRSRCLELRLDAVDERNILSVLSRFLCSTTCCCITARTVGSDDFFRSVYRNIFYKSGQGICRHTCIIFEYPRWRQLKSYIYPCLHVGFV